MATYYRHNKINVTTTTLSLHSASCHRRSFLAGMCCMLKPGQYTAAANMLKVHRNTISAHCHLLGELIKTNDMGQEYLQVRGLERSSGALAKTSVETIESVVQYYIASATTCAGNTM